jgi:hypothetical protein
LKISIITFVLLIVAGTSALAHQDPPPPPSGIVIHLFGPDSGSSHILPTAPPPPGGVAPASGAVRAPAAASENYPEPSWGDVLHQMFVTGDPDQLPGQALSAGRASKPPAP